jgi:DNA-binding response OmpR family regulator
MINPEGEPRFYLALHGPDGETMSTVPIADRLSEHPDGIDLAVINGLAANLRRWHGLDESAPVRVHMRPEAPNPIRAFGDGRITFDTAQRRAVADGMILDLTPKGITLLDTLTAKPDTYLKYNEIAQSVYGDAIHREIGLRVLVSKVRRELGMVDPDLKWAIGMQRYFGYAVLTTLQHAQAKRAM